MDKNLKVSIIVPMYNSSKFINNLINSVEVQTYKNYELILVDDGSNDKSYEIVCDIAKKNEKIKAFKKENSGPGKTRQFGYERANGDLLFFVDSDDWITNETTLQNIVEIFNEFNPDILFFDREDIIGKTTNIIKGFENFKPGLYDIGFLNKKIHPGLGCKIFKRELLEKDMFFDSKIFEDLYTSYKYLNRCNNFYYIDKCFYTIFHEVESNSLSYECNVDSYKNYKKAVDIINEIYNNAKNDSLKKSIAEMMPDFFWIYYINRIKGIDSFRNDDMDKKIYEMSVIIKKLKLKIHPNKFKILKLIIYYYFLYIIN